MTVGATTATTTPTTSASSSSSQDTARTTLSQNFDTFLTLLTTQMKNQDPLSPMDSTQFTQQIVEMTGVQSQIQTNDYLKQLVANTAGGIQAAVSMIGKNVKVATDTAHLANGKADWTYNLANDASDVKIQIADANGNVVDTETVPADGMTAGDHAFSWNGKNQIGDTLPDGDYKITVTATDSTGASIASTTYIQGLVSGVEQDSGSTYITVNGAKAPWASVTTITQPDTATASTSGSSSNSTSSNSTTGDQTSSQAAA